MTHDSTPPRDRGPDDRHLRILGVIARHTREQADRQDEGSGTDGRAPARRASLRARAVRAKQQLAAARTRRSG